MRRLGRVANHIVPSQEGGSHSVQQNHVEPIAAAGMAAARLQGKIAIVTGAGSGIGRSTSLLFAWHGASVLCVDMNHVQVVETVDMIIQAGGRAKVATADVGEEADNEAIVNACVAEFGGLDIFFANAGVAGSLIPFWEVDAAAWSHTLRVNTIGVSLGFKYAALYMRKQSKVSGSLIATASVAGIRSGAGDTIYSASKAAVISLVQTCANQLAGTGIRCNAICPGLVETGMTKPFFDMARSRNSEGKIGQLNPSKRAGTTEDVANMALFLGSEESSYINGQALVVDGGLSSSLPVVLGKMA